VDSGGVVAVFVRGGVVLGEGLLCVLGEGDLCFPGSGGGVFSFSPLSGVFAGEVVFFSPDREAVSFLSRPY
jgi:hypothetical protein